MADNFKIVNGAIGAQINPGQSFTIPYPADTTSNTFYADGHIFILNGQRTYTDPAQAGISFGVSNITITNNTTIPWVNGDSYEIQLNSVPVDSFPGDVNVARNLYVNGDLVPNSGDVSALAAAQVATFAANPTSNAGFIQEGWIKAILGNYPILQNTTLRDWQRGVEKLVGGTSAQPTALFIGDSWTAFLEGFVTKQTRVLKSKLGDAGPGFCSFSSNAYSFLAKTADETNVTLARFGTWSAGQADGVGPDISQSVSSQVGAKITLTLAGNQNAPVAILHYLKKSGGGIFRYRWNGGSWTSVDTSNASNAYTNLTLSGNPGGAWVLEIEVEAASTNGVTLFGVDLRNFGAGVRIHRAAVPGTNTQQWAGVDSTLWRAGITALNPDVAFICFGTNDQGMNMAPSAYKTYLTTIVQRLRQVRAGMDIVIMMPFENIVPGRTIPMTSYCSVAIQVANEQKTGYIDLCVYAGASTSEYNDSAPRVLISSLDPYHPTQEGFWQISKIVDAVMRPNGEAVSGAASRIDPVAASGTSFVLDLRTAAGFPAVKGPSGGETINDLSGNNRVSSFGGTAAAAYSSGGVAFNGAANPIYAIVPGSALAPLVADQQWMVTGYFKFPTAADWFSASTSTARMFFDFTGNSNITSQRGLVAVAQAWNGTAPFLAFYTTGGSSLASYNITAANTAPFLGTVVQLSVWRTSSNLYLRLKNADYVYTYSTAAPAANTTDFSQYFGAVGIVPDATYRPTGNATNFSLYRFWVENLTAGRDPQSLLDSDWTYFARTQPLVPETISDSVFVTGVTDIHDLSTSRCHPKQAPLVNNDLLTDVSGNGNTATLVLAGGSTDFTGLGLDFTSVTGNSYLSIPATSIAGLFASQQFLACMYIKMLASADWWTGGASAKLFVDFSANGANGITQGTAGAGIYAIGWGYTGSARQLVVFRTAGASGTTEVVTVSDAQLTNFYGTVTQISVWRTASDWGVTLRNSAGTVTVANGSAGNAATYDWSALFGTIGAPGSAFRPSGNQLKFKLYRMFIENLALSGRNPAYVAAADWSRRSPFLS